MRFEQGGIFLQQRIEFVLDVAIEALDRDARHGESCRDVVLVLLQHLLEQRHGIGVLAGGEEHATPAHHRQRGGGVGGHGGAEQVVGAAQVAEREGGFGARQRIAGAQQRLVAIARGLDATVMQLFVALAQWGGTTQVVVDVGGTRRPHRGQQQQRSRHQCATQAVRTGAACHCRLQYCCRHW